MTIKNMLHFQQQRLLKNHNQQAQPNEFNQLQYETLQDVLKLSQNIKCDLLVKMISFSQKQWILNKIKEQLYQKNNNINEINSMLAMMHKFSREDLLTNQILIQDFGFLSFLLHELITYINFWIKNKQDIYAVIATHIIKILNNIYIDLNDEYIQFQQYYQDQYIQCLLVTSDIFKEYLRQYNSQSLSDNINMLVCQYFKFLRMAIQNIYNYKLIDNVVQLMLVLPTGVNQFETLLRVIGGQVNTAHLKQLENQLYQVADEFSTESVQDFLVACLDNDKVDQIQLQSYISTYISIKLNKQLHQIITKKELKLINWLIQQKISIKQDDIYKLIEQIIFTVRSDNYQFYRDTLFNILSMLQSINMQETVDLVLYTLRITYRTSLLLDEVIQKFASIQQFYQ